MPGNSSLAEATKDRGLSHQINAKCPLPQQHACNLGACESREERGVEHAMIDPQKAGSNCESAPTRRQLQNPEVDWHADLDLRLGRTVLKCHDVWTLSKVVLLAYQSLRQGRGLELSQSSH
jgi:hypothetical protein